MKLALDIFQSVVENFMTLVRIMGTYIGIHTMNSFPECAGFIFKK
jgi:hypothetical protein